MQPTGAAWFTTIITGIIVLNWTRHPPNMQSNKFFTFFCFCFFLIFFFTGPCYRIAKLFLHSFSINGNAIHAGNDGNTGSWYYCNSVNVTLRSKKFKKQFDFLLKKMLLNFKSLKNPDRFKFQLDRSDIGRKGQVKNKYVVLIEGRFPLHKRIFKVSKASALRGSKTI